MPQVKINIQEKKDRLSQKLEGWKVVQDFVQSSAFDSVMLNLISQVENDNRFTPKFKDIFNAFIHCPYDKLKVIFVGQDPYPQLDVADGISFSCSKTMKEQPSLRYIFDEIERTVYSPKIDKDESTILREGYNPDLKRWSKQGVLMLNTALTVAIGKIGSHYDIWKPFASYLFTELNKRDDLVFVCLGKKAEQWESYMNNNHVIKVTHPASAAYKGGKWNSQDLFNQVNNYLESIDKSLIVW